MLSTTDRRLSLTQGDAAALAAHALSPCKMPGAHPEKLFLFLGPFPAPGVCSGSQDKNHSLN